MSYNGLRGNFSAGHSHTVEAQLVSGEVGIQEVPVLIELDIGHDSSIL